MALRTVCSPHPKLRAMAGTRSPRALARTIWQRRKVKASAERVDEPVWELPLARRYRKELDSIIADLRNMGGANAGSITAALFLEEFVNGIPWAHIDIAGTAQSASAEKWRNKGTTGFGTRLLIDLAMNFRK